MLPELVDALACPQCHQPLAQSTGTLRCRQHHAYDIARHGYVTLRPGAGPRHDGDDAAMVAARVELLAAGAYDGLIAYVAAAAVLAYPGSGVVLDAGGGTGAYLARVLDRLRGLDRQAASVTAVGSVACPGSVAPLGLVLDSSPYALRRAARAHPAIGAVGCDLWQRWPVRDETIGLGLDVFAPRNGAEARRVLRPGGALLVVTPRPNHLAELVETLGLLCVDGRKDERIRQSLQPHLSWRSRSSYEERVELGHPEIEAVAAMGPSARHHDPAAMRDRIAALPERTTVTISVRIDVWHRDPEPPRRTPSP